MATTHVPRPAQVQNADRANAVALLVLAAAMVAAAPGALIGAVLTSAVWRAIRLDIGLYALSREL